MYLITSNNKALVFFFYIYSLLGNMSFHLEVQNDKKMCKAN